MRHWETMLKHVSQATSALHRFAADCQLRERCRIPPAKCQEQVFQVQEKLSKRAAQRHTAFAPGGGFKGLLECFGSRAKGSGVENVCFWRQAVEDSGCDWQSRQSSMVETRKAHRVADAGGQACFDTDSSSRRPPTEAAETKTFQADLIGSSFACYQPEPGYSTSLEGQVVQES